LHSHKHRCAQPLLGLLLRCIAKSKGAPIPDASSVGLLPPPPPGKWGGLLLPTPVPTSKGCSSWPMCGSGATGKNMKRLPLLVATFAFFLLTQRKGNSATQLMPAAHPPAKYLCLLLATFAFVLRNAKAQVQRKGKRGGKRSKGC
jgi:hypothetical protein